MAVTRRARPSRVTLVVLVVVSLALITVDYRGSSVLDGVRSVAWEVVSPLRGGLEAVARPFANAWHGVTDFDETKRENDRLRAELEAARGQAVAAEGAEAQLAEMSKLLGLDFVGDIPRVAARVVGFAASNFDQTVEIDTGSASGVKVGMPVVNGSGLVGTVVRVARNRSFVRLLTDASFAAGVTLPGATDNGLAKGQGVGKPLSIGLIDTKSAVTVGDVVVTSGQGGSRFPPGITVGTVRSASTSPGALEQAVTMDPAVDTERLGFVAVLVWLPQA